jgi:hypothetical protein
MKSSSSEIVPHRLVIGWLINYQVKEDEMGRACSTNGEKTAYRILVGKPEGKRPLERPRLRRVNNIKMNLREIGCGGME